VACVLYLWRRYEGREGGRKGGREGGKLRAQGGLMETTALGVGEDGPFPCLALFRAFFGNQKLT
jgi:hypothetical protein